MEQPFTKGQEPVMPQFLLHGEEMGQRIREFDWSLTSLKAVATWPQSLQSALSICLNSNFPIAIYWGRDLVLLYNDAWSPIPGNKHPWALGRPAREVWPDIWDAIEPQFQKAFSGEPGGSKEALLPMQRHGYIEECYFDFTFTPIYGESGKVDGIFNAVIETTYRIISERRTAFLKNLTLSISGSQSIQQLFENAMRFVASFSKDIPFALLYSYEDGEVKLAASSIRETEIAFASAGWPLERIARDGKSFYIGNLNDYLVQKPLDYWKQRPTEAVIVPLTNSSGFTKEFLVCGLSTRRRFDEEYKLFIEGVANVITNVSNNIAALEEERKRSEALAEIDKAKTIFFSNISHEFCTPLTLILGSLEEMLKNHNRDATDKKAIETTHRNALRLLRLVNNLLDFSRIEAGKGKGRHLHGGEISVSSTAGIGTEFTVSIPTGKTHIPHEQIIEKDLDFNGALSETFMEEAFYLLEQQFLASEGNEFQAPENSPTVLVIDDNAEIRIYLKALLQKHYRIVTASNGMEGLHKIKELNPTLVISDVMMPVMDGIQLVKEIKQNPATNNLPVILLSARAGEEAKIEGYGTGAEDYLVKPFSAKELLSRVESQIKLKQNRENILKNLYSVFDEVPFAVAVLMGEDLVLEFINQYNLSIWQRLKEDVLGKPLYEIFPGNREAVEAVHRQVYETGKRFTANEITVEVLTDDKMQARWFNTVIDPLRNENGQVIGQLASTIEVTEQVLARKKVEESQQELQNLFRQAPAAIAVIEGREHKYVMANKLYQQLFDRTEDQLLGKTITEVFPEVKNQGFFEIFETVYRTGKPFVANEFPVGLDKHGTGEQYTGYYNFVAQPIKNVKDEVSSILIHAFEITEQVQARKKLEESEQRFRSLADQSPMIVYIVEPDEAATMSYFNKTWLDYTGQTFDQALGRAWEGIVHPNDLQVVLDIYVPAFKNRVPYVIPAVRLKRHDGEYRWHIFKGNPRYLPNGEFIGFIGVGFDINEQKIADEKIRESEQRFRSLAETLPQMVWMRNSEGMMEFASKNWEEYSGIKNTSEAWKAMTHPEDWEPVMNVWQQAVQARTSFQYEVRLKNKAGEYRWHYAVGEPVKNESGEVVKYIGALTDIHIQKTFAEKLEKEVAERTAELKAKNEDLQKTQSFLQQLIDSSVEYITVLDKELRFVTVNKRYEDTMGISRRQLQGKHLFDVTPKAAGSLQHESILKALKGETVYLDKRQAISKTEMYVDTYYIPLRTHNVVEGIIIMARDVTAIVQSEKLLEQMNYELHRSNEDLQQFAHVASHDLKEPVRKVKIFASRLEAELSDQMNERSKLYLSKIHSATNRMFTMIDGVLTYSSINASAQLAEKVDLNQVMKSIETDLEIPIQHSGSNISYKHLPVVEGAAVLLYQLFYNLINNSIKFAKDGVPPEISILSEIVSKQGQEWAQIKVTDNSIGFEQIYAKNIFNTFSRLHSRETYEGTGLGLALCKKIVERHGGQIEAEGTLGKGATFVITLPLEQNVNVI